MGSPVSATHHLNYRPRVGYELSGIIAGPPGPLEGLFLDSWKSGLELSRTSLTSLRGTGRLGGTAELPYPPGTPGGGCQRGLMPRCEMEVKLDRSDSAGLRAPSGMLRTSSYESVA